MKKKEVIKTQKGIIKDFTESKGLTKIRKETAQIWLNENHSIADAVNRERKWKFGILVKDYLNRIVNNPNMEGRTGY